jgi:hypothetical protein
MMWGALSNEMTGFKITAGPRQRSHSRIRVRSPYSYPPGTGWPSYIPGQCVLFSSPTRRAAVHIRKGLLLKRLVRARYTASERTAQKRSPQCFFYYCMWNVAAIIVYSAVTTKRTTYSCDNSFQNPLSNTVSYSWLSCSLVSCEIFPLIVRQCRVKVGRSQWTSLRCGHTSAVAADNLSSLLIISRPRRGSTRLLRISAGAKPHECASIT